MRIIVDCNNVGHTMLYAMGPKSGAFGFLKYILMLSKKFQTRDFIFCWDSRESYRKEIYPEYKANRHEDKSAEDLKQLEAAYKQFDLLREEILPGMGFKNVFMRDGYEADDLIAWIVHRMPAESVIASSDHDLWQLLSDDKFNPVSVYCLRKKAVFAKNDFIAGCQGIEPIEWQKVKAIAGCDSDNVLGVKGVGELTAIRYLVGALSDGVVKKRIVESKDLIATNMGLVALPFRGKIDIDIELRPEGFSRGDFKTVFRKFEYLSFLKGNCGQWRGFFEDDGDEESVPDRAASVKGFAL